MVVREEESSTMKETRPHRAPKPKLLTDSMPASRLIKFNYPFGSAS